MRKQQIFDGQYFDAQKKFLNSFVPIRGAERWRGRVVDWESVAAASELDEGRG